MILPSHFTLSSGVGIDKYKLVSFDKALFNAGISNYNLVRVSSILPPDCSQSNIVNAEKGAVLFTAYSSISDCAGNSLISAAVGVGIPQSRDDVGVIMEYACNDSKKVSAEYVEQMILSSMELRNIKIKQIEMTSCESLTHEGLFTTAMAALVMW